MSNSSNVVPLGAPSAGPAADEALRQEAMLLQWLGEETLTFNRAYVDVTGNVLSALWLAYVLERMPAFLREGRGSAVDQAYSFAMTGQECEAGTGISRAQQATCRKQLADLGLLSENGARGKAVLYTIHLDRLRGRLNELAAPLMQALRDAGAPGTPPRAGGRRRRAAR